MNKKVSDGASDDTLMMGMVRAGGNPLPVFVAQLHTKTKKKKEAVYKLVRSKDERGESNAR